MEVLRAHASLMQQTGFSIMGVLFSHQIFSLLDESLSSLYCYLKWDIDFKKSLWNLNKTMNLFSRKPKKISACRTCFYKNLQFLTTKAHHRQRTFSPPLPSLEFLKGCPPLNWPKPNGKLWWVKRRVLVGFQEPKPKTFLAFNVYKVIKWVTMALKLYLWLKKQCKTYLFFLANAPTPG